MFSLSLTTEHAIRALSYLSDEKICRIREIAETTGIGQSTVAKIVNLLTNTGLIATKRGHCGGVLLTRPATEITLLQISEAVEGDGWERRCLLGRRNCDRDNMCATHDLWAELKSRIRDSLRKVTLADLRCSSQKQGKKAVRKTNQISKAGTPFLETPQGSLPSETDETV